MSDVPVVEVDKAPREGESVFVNGVEYVISSTLSRRLNIHKSGPSKFARMGMPHAKASKGKNPIYPVEACRAWHEGYRKGVIENRGSYHRRKIIIDGVMHYDAKELSEALGVCDKTVVHYQRYSGMPSIMHGRFRYYPLIECLKWWEDREKMKTLPPQERNALAEAEADARERKRGASLCNRCDNAYAHKCCWMRNMTPVKGWEAEKFELYWGVSYYVHKCPNFVPDPPRKETPW